MVLGYFTLAKPGSKQLLLEGCHLFPWGWKSPNKMQVLIYH